MNILLIGGSCSLINNLIVKFRKEGHRVYLLTGEKYQKKKYEKVFETYNFTYDSEKLSDIIDSVNPDVTICMGAFDSNYRWKEEREAVKVSSHLVNILMACTQEKKGKVIFISSDEVYYGDYEEKLQEESPLSGKGVRASMLIQAESICRNFRQNWGLDLTVLRLDHVYNQPKRPEDVNHIGALMCLEALKTGCITVQENHEFSLLNEKDAVEFIYCIAKEPQKHEIYHLSSEIIVSEVELAGMIQKSFTEPINVIVTEEIQERCVLSAERFKEEYRKSAICELEPAIRKMASYMQKHKALFVDLDEEKLPWWKRLLNQWAWLIRSMIPFLENMICFIPFFMMNNRTVGSQYFANLDPYLLYVLLFAIVYGQQQATFSAILAVAGYLFRQMYTRSGFEVVLDYNTYVWIAQLFILGLVVGYMRDQIRLMRMESKEMEEHLSRQIVDIKEINESNVRVKEIMEHQLIEHEDSIGKIYSITSKLDQQEPEEVLFDAVEMMKELMHTEDVAIYNIVNEDYARMFSASSVKSRSLGNSIRYKEMEAVYDELKEQKVYINKSMDERYPLMANAIFEGGQMKMLIFLWGLGWERMTLGQANYLVVVSYLIQNAVLRARRYMSVLEEKRYLKKSRILEPDAFRTLVKSYSHAANRNLVEYTLLRIHTPNKIKTTANETEKFLRSTDYFGVLSNKKLYVLLSNTSAEDAVFVQKRFAENGYETTIERMTEVWKEE